MPDIINLLPDSIANQIAAGEVVQRPASIVKELLENSIDAGGKNIKLIIKESGKSLVQVVDDGSGMSETDARMCFERHATSKIKKAEDLFNIHTMGFRGEALASIASVSKVELRTKKPEDEIGTSITIEGSKLVSHEPNACNSGTSISVKNLFYNIPVRKNFLKSDAIEYRHIIDEFYRVALSYPQISFSLHSDQTEVYHLNASSLRQRIINLFGKRYDKNIVPVEEETPIVKVKGFIGKPEYAKKKRGEQFIFVNNRFIKNLYFNHAIIGAYDTLLPAETYPFYILYFEIPPEKIDVNVHPTKTEIKFEDDKAIYSILKSSIRKSLSQNHIAPSLDFEQEAFMNSLHAEERENKQDNEKIKFGFSGDFQSVSRSSSMPTVKASENDWKELLKVLKLEKGEEESVMPENTIDDDLKDIDQNIKLDENLEKKVMQVHKKYIFTPIHSGIVLINQQYAHQRILFEEFEEKIGKQNIACQKQMFPEVIEFKEDDFKTFNEIRELLETMGFEFEPFGQRAFTINGTPANLKIDNVKAFIEEALEDYNNNLGNSTKEIKIMIAQTLAISASVKPGQILNKEEMSLMIDKLFACKNPYYSPMGKPTFLKIDESELDKKFE